MKKEKFKKYLKGLLSDRREIINLIAETGGIAEAIKTVEDACKRKGIPAPSGLKNTFDQVLADNIRFSAI